MLLTFKRKSISGPFKTLPFFDLRWTADITVSSLPARTSNGALSVPWGEIAESPLTYNLYCLFIGLLLLIQCETVSQFKSPTLQSLPALFFLWILSLTVSNVMCGFRAQPTALLEYSLWGGLRITTTFSLVFLLKPLTPFNAEEYVWCQSEVCCSPLWTFESTFACLRLLYVKWYYSLCYSRTVGASSFCCLYAWPAIIINPRCHWPPGLFAPSGRGSPYVPSEWKVSGKWHIVTLFEIIKCLLSSWWLLCLRFIEGNNGGGAADLPSKQCNFILLGDNIGDLRMKINSTHLCSFFSFFSRVLNWKQLCRGAWLLLDCC